VGSIDIPTINIKCSFGGKMKYCNMVVFFLFVRLSVFSQDRGQSLPQIAVVEFEGRGVSKTEAELFTDRFRGELVKTNAFVVLDREQMKSILEEQAFQQTGCTSTECAVEIGKILNIQKIFTGKIGRVGNTYTIDISYIDIETSRIERSFNRDHEGDIDGILPILKEIIIEILPPRKGISTIPLYASGIIAIGSAGVGTFSYLKAQSSYQKYKDAETAEDSQKYKEDTEKYDNITLICGITAGVSTIFYFVYRHYYKRSKKPANFYAAPYMLDRHTIGLAVNISL
jgi:hypothetical protein